MTTTLTPTPDLTADGMIMDEIAHAVAKLIRTGRGWLTFEQATPPNVASFAQHKYSVTVDVTGAIDFCRCERVPLGLDGWDLDVELTMMKAETIGPRLIATWHIEIA